MQKLAFTLLTTCLLVGLTANAEAKDHGKKRFAKADLNGDGVISLDEFQAPRDKKHNREHKREHGPDQNGDGEVTREEVEQQIAERTSAMSERMLERFSRMDLNDDGVVIPEEAKQAMFNRLDVNDDGVISKKEMKQAKRGHGPRGH